MRVVVEEVVRVALKNVDYVGSKKEVSGVTEEREVESMKRKV